MSIVLALSFFCLMVFILTNSDKNIIKADEQYIVRDQINLHFINGSPYSYNNKDIIDTFIVKNGENNINDFFNFLQKNYSGYNEKFAGKSNEYILLNSVPYYYIRDMLNNKVNVKTPASNLAISADAIEKGFYNDLLKQNKINERLRKNELWNLGLID